MPRSLSLLLPALGLATMLTAAPSLPAPPAAPVTRLAEFVVTPSRFGVAEVPTTMAASLTGAELEVLPQLGDDLFRSIARLPGLAADDISAQFWVRGAPHGQLLARLDGVDLIEPFHLKDVDGALSIVDPAAIRGLDLSTGGFSAEFGDRLAGVLTMETSSEVRPQTALNLSLTGLGALQRGTIAGRRGRWLATVRRGYPDVALRAAGRDDDVRPRYYDAMAKVEFDLSPANTVSVHALHAGDDLRYVRTNSPSLTSRYDSDTVWARWRGLVRPALQGEAVLSWTRLTWQRDGTGRMDGFPFLLRDHRRLSLVALRNEWTHQLAEMAMVRGGVEARSGAARYSYVLSHQYTGVEQGAQVVVRRARDAALAPEGEGVGAFVSVKTRVLPRLVVEPGLRFDRADQAGAGEWNPRLNAAMALGHATLRAAWGGYSQSQGLHELAVADGETAFARPERAEHRVLGVEWPLGPRVGLRLEAYQRLATRVRPRWVNLDNVYDLFPEAQSDRVRLAPDRGRAEGVEFLLSSRGQGRLQWHLSHALARTEEKIDGRWVPRARDQRHAFHADATYRLSPRWQFSAAWHFRSGWPTTDLIHTLAPLNNGRRLLVSANGPAYGLRLPAYHRLDLRATHRLKVRHGEFRVFADLFNAYDRVNVLGYDHRVSVSGTQVTSRREPREQLPFLPSLGISWTLP